MMKRTAQHSNNDMQRNVLSAMNIQKMKVEEKFQLLLDNPTAEELLSYRELIKDLISLVVARLYIINVGSNWENMPKYNLYEQISDIESLLDITIESMEQDNTEIFTEQCIKVNSLVNDFLVDICNGDYV